MARDDTFIRPRRRDKPAAPAPRWHAATVQTEAGHHGIAKTPSARAYLTPNTAQAFHRVMRVPQFPMTSEELRQWRRTMGLTQAQANAALGISRVPQYERGEPIPHAISLACSMLYAFPDTTVPSESLRDWRFRNDLTLQVVAPRLGVTAQTLNRIELGQVKPRRFYRLAIMAIEHGLRPWPQLRRYHRLKLLE